MRLSVVIPAHNEAGSIAATLDGHRARARPRRRRLRDPRRRRRERRTAPAAWSPRARGRATRECAASARTYPRGFGFAVRAGLDDFAGDAVAIVMADGSDAPEDLVAYHRLLEAGYDCAFGSRFIRGATVDGYPRPKLVLNRLVNCHPDALPARLQRHDERLQGLPARGDRDGPAAALEPLQPHRRAAAEGDRARPQLRRRPDLAGRTARRGRRS